MEIKNMKNKISKKIIGGLIVVSILATIGAVIVSADINENGKDKNWPFRFKARHQFFSELTEEQRDEIKEIKDTMLEEGKTKEEIREAIKLQLESYGIEVPTIEEKLDNSIANTEQKLDILNYIKEALDENPDLTKEDIRNLVEEEFDIEFPEFNEDEMNFKHGFKGRHCKGF
jgi:uncharacterized protein YpuA (DUF1002 family)